MPEPANPTPGGATPENEPEIYDLEPDPAEPEPPPPPRPVTAGPPAPPAAGPRPAATAMARTPDAPFTRGLGGIRAAMTAAGVLVLLALVLSGVRAGGTDLGPLVATLGGALLTMLVSGALGTLAVIAAARCVGTRIAEPELFALRMLAASAAFTLMERVGTPIPSGFDDWLLGVAAYATTVWLFFRLGPRETGLVLAWHGGLIGLLWLQLWIMRDLGTPGPGAATPTTPGEADRPRPPR